MLSTDKQTNKQTDRQTSQRYQKHNLLCQDNYYEFLNIWLDNLMIYMNFTRSSFFFTLEIFFMKLKHHKLQQLYYSASRPELYASSILINIGHWQFSLYLQSCPCIIILLFVMYKIFIASMSHQQVLLFIYLSFLPTRSGTDLAHGISCYQL